MTRAIFVFLFASFVAACGGMSPTGEVGSALVGPPPSDGGICVPNQTACNATRTGVYECVTTASGSYWTGVSGCDYGCITATDANGYERDHCAPQCTPGTRYCDGTEHVCNSQGLWLNGGLCTPKCGCGGTYPHCRICT